MQSVHRIFDYRQKSEGGFVLIAAILAVMILVAVGFFALTVSSQDIIISSRLVGERKALSAAEAGVHQVCILLNPDPTSLALNFPINSAYVDQLNDPSTTYSATTPVRNFLMPSIPVHGYGMTPSPMLGSVYDTTVTGRDASYGSSVSIAIGTAYLPNPADTQQGQL